MKKLLLVLLLVPLVSCTSDDTNETSENSVVIDSCQVETVSDIDGNVYEVVSIGSQCWLKQNYRVTKYQNGESIENGIGLSDYDWGQISVNENDAYCLYENNESKLNDYGLLYNGLTLFLNTREISVPDGWRIAEREDWEKLFDELGGPKFAGDKMKLKSADNFNNTGTNSSGFSAFASGHRLGYVGDSRNGNFVGGAGPNQGSATFWVARSNFNNIQLSGSRGSAFYSEGANSTISFSIRLVKK